MNIPNIIAIFNLNFLSNFKFHILPIVYFNKHINYIGNIKKIKFSSITIIIILSFQAPFQIYAQGKGSLGVMLTAVCLERNYDPLFKETLFPATNFTFKYGFSRGIVKEIFLKKKSYLSIGLLYSTNFYQLRQESDFSIFRSVGINSNLKLIKIEIPIQFRYYLPLNDNLDLGYALGVCLDYVPLRGRSSKFKGGVGMGGPTINPSGGLSPIAVYGEWICEAKNPINPALIPGLYLKFKGSGRRYWIFGITGHIYAPSFNISSNVSIISGSPSVTQYSEKESSYFAPNYISCQVQYMFSRKKK